jgi:hypothetical protein
VAIRNHLRLVLVVLSVCKGSLCNAKVKHVSNVHVLDHLVAIFLASDKIVQQF